MRSRNRSCGVARSNTPSTRIPGQARPASCGSNASHKFGARAGTFTRRNHHAKPQPRKIPALRCARARLRPGTRVTTVQTRRRIRNTSNATPHTLPIAAMRFRPKAAREAFRFAWRVARANRIAAMGRPERTRVRTAVNKKRAPRTTSAHAAHVLGVENPPPPKNKKTPARFSTDRRLEPFSGFYEKITLERCAQHLSALTSRPCIFLAEKRARDH